MKLPSIAIGTALRQLHAAWPLALLLLTNQLYAQTSQTQATSTLGNFKRWEQEMSRWGSSIDALLEGKWLQTGTSKEAQSPSPADTAIAPQATARSAQSDTSPSHNNEPVEFDVGFLRSSKIDLSKFARADYILPGLNTVEVRVNGVRAFVDAVRFEAGSDGSGLPCLTVRQIAQTNVIVDFDAQEGTCYPVARLAPGAGFRFDSAEQVLDLVIAQAYVRAGGGWVVDPSLWDAGIPAFRSQYSLTGNDSRASGKTSHSLFGRFDNTLSAAGWQLKNSLLINQIPQGWKTQSLNTYARTDLASVRGEFRVGNFYTTGILYDTLNLNGVSLTSYDEFLSDKELGYAPLIRGVADTNATVTITQNGLQIYKTNVPPGPFAISDLGGAGYSGTLLVTVTEANGQQKTFLTPYTAQVQMLRKGQFKYAMHAGRLSSTGTSYSDRPQLTQLTVQFGLLSTVTVYGGLTESSHYRSRLGGLALSSFAGTLSYDQTLALTQLENDKLEGMRQRLSYTKTIEASRTLINLSQTHNRNGQYRTVNDAMQLSSPMDSGSLAGSISTLTRHQTLAMLSQPLGQLGDLTLSMVRSRFVGGTPDNNSYTMGWRRSFANMSLSLSATRQLVSAPGQVSAVSKSFSAQLSIPLDKVTGFAGVGVTSSSGQLTTQAYYNQTVGDDQRWSLNLTANSTGGSGSSGSGQTTYRSPWGTHAIGVSTGQNYSSLNFSSMGGMVLHSGGLTFGPSVSDTMGIVYAPGGAGAGINGMQGAVVNRKGYGLVTNLRPFRINQVYLDPMGMETDVELSVTSQQAIARSGGIVLLPFPTSTGRGLLLTLKRTESMEEVPFGATVNNAQGQEVGVVGQTGRVFLRGIASSGKLQVFWGSEVHETCSINYALPAKNPDSPFDLLSAECR